MMNGTGTRRALLLAAYAAGTGLAINSLLRPARAGADDAAIELIKQLTGRTPTQSDRLRLEMPAVFPTGYTVPMTITVDTPMTEADHVRHIRVIAPKNPIIAVADFHFSPNRSVAHVSTRIRLAEPQHVLAVADMSDGALLMAKAWVDVASNGCV